VISGRRVSGALSARPEALLAGAHQHRTDILERRHDERLRGTCRLDNISDRIGGLSPDDEDIAALVSEAFQNIEYARQLAEQRS